MPPKRTSRVDEAAAALIAVAPLASRWIERLLGAHQPPLTLTQFLALRAIAREGVSGAELARRAGVSGAAVSQLLGSLGHAGLISRSELAEDRRRHLVMLSARGHEALTGAERLLQGRLGSLLAELPRPEADALARALPRVEASLSGAPPPRRPAGPPPSPRHPRHPL